ncbi:hypothetical protein SAMN05216262_103140 [Colwellia chukchiensis]|uniref:Uncharacterized protein n=1 Tax=Colwellia chukchiensis TaxID=641665 RepID=A0A1H7KJF4_9GAMM|nr:hypothetical protein [Colwellia chukchiensis]CCQ10859.1 hypothetical protein PALB_17330 [Pseudoalteromonas luteoviolacea B = ATCC 29581]SEK86047.1 hypothetical protein SAMN05216262_103140 [Colwellia chukchiensis]
MKYNREINQLENAGAAAGNIIGAVAINGFMGLSIAGKLFVAAVMLLTGLGADPVLLVGSGLTLFFALALVPNLLGLAIIISGVYWAASHWDWPSWLALALYFLLILTASSMHLLGEIDDNGDLQKSPDIIATTQFLSSISLLALGTAYYWEFNVFNLEVHGYHFALWFVTAVFAQITSEATLSDRKLANVFNYLFSLLATYWFTAIFTLDPLLINSTAELIKGIIL